LSTIERKRAGERLRKIISIAEKVVDEIRYKYLTDIEEYLANGYSEHDCVEINGTVAEILKKRYRLDAELVPVHPLLNYISNKHYAVLLRINRKEYIIDAVPEMTGLFNYIYDAIVCEKKKYAELVLEATS